MLAYLPYFDQPSLELGPLTLHAFGTLVLIAVVLGWQITMRRARRHQLDRDVIEGAAYWAVVAGFVFGHVFQVLWYRPELLETDPLAILRLWEGLSSYGGFAGAAIGLTVFFYRQKNATFMQYTDALAYGFVPAWIFGRLGCTIAHDHPGLKTDFFLAFEYPAGHEYAEAAQSVVRHNLGFYEAIFALCLTVFLVWFGRKARKQGMITGLVFIIYAPVRFGMDFLRATDLSSSDLRAGGLTPAQWASFVLLGIGVFMVVRARRASTPELPLLTDEELAALEEKTKRGGKQGGKKKVKK